MSARWISVKDALPPERKVVLCWIRVPERHTDGHCHYPLVGYIRVHSGGPFWVVPNPWGHAEVLHWMDAIPGQQQSGHHWWVKGPEEI